MSEARKTKQAGPYEVLSDGQPSQWRNSMLPSTHREGGNGKNGDAVIPKKMMIEWLSPKEIFEFEPPADYHIVGDNFIFRGGMTIVAGAAGAGKSRALTWLGLCGVFQTPWFGMKIHRPFKTMLLQAENDEVRLQDELRGAGVKFEDIQDSLRISRIPRFGMNLADKDFQDQLRRDIDEFRPDIFGVDPWNRCVSDGMQKDYRAAIDGLYSIFPEKIEYQPCLVIGSHTRKPKENEKANGRELLNLISGSLILGSAARSAIFLQSVSSDETDKRIVATVAKCNNGLLPDSSAWERANGPFKPQADFDITQWKESCASTGAGGHNEKITEKHLQDLFQNGGISYPKGEAVQRLMKLSGSKDKAAYAALSDKGRFADLLKFEGKMVSLVVAPWDELEGKTLDSL